MDEQISPNTVCARQPNDAKLRRWFGSSIRPGHLFVGGMQRSRCVLPQETCITSRKFAPELWTIVCWQKGKMRYGMPHCSKKIDETCGKVVLMIRSSQMRFNTGLLNMMNCFLNVVFGTGLKMSFATNSSDPLAGTSFKSSLMLRSAWFKGHSQQSPNVVYTSLVT